MNIKDMLKLANEFAECGELCSLKEKQKAEIERLEKELKELEEAGDEYHAEGVRQDLAAARSLARLVHKHRKAFDERLLRKYATEFKFRAETMVDVGKLKKLLDKLGIETSDWKVKPQFHGDMPLPDVTVTFRTDILLGQLKHIIALVPDGHVMHQTIAPVDAYTGERTYERPEEPN